jgi:cellulose synthase/poly-beta-1,6-N-acetylglucosamine synthase-like glycosyltransferase
MFAPPVTIVVPAYNEEVGIEATVRSLAASDYPVVQIVVVDDGSTDRTSAVLQGLELPDVTVIRQPNAGKAEALNAGIQVAAHDIIVTVDADTVFETDTVAWLVQPFENPAVGAVSGNTKVGNRGRLIGRWQHIEYVMGFNLDRRLYDILGCMTTVPGAVGAFRREVLDQVGGVSSDTLAEDTDLTMAIIRSGWRVAYEQRARAWTEAPSDLSSLWKQRYRWSYGTMQAMWKHRGAVREPGPLGRRALPYLLLFHVLLPLLAPVVDLFTVFGLLFLQPLPLLGFWIGFNLVNLALAAYAFRLDHESSRVLWALVAQQFVYRQLMYLVVVQSAVTAALGTTLGWHKLERSGQISTT